MMAPNPRVLCVLTGPTASGKTELALRWAERAGAEIISCDSLLFYRGMDVGTAKPTPAERARVRHHLIDIAEVTEPMNVTRYAARARAAAEDILARGRRVLVAGGSGFYLRSFFAPVADETDAPAELRVAVAEKLEREGLAALVAELQARNPQGLGALDTRNPRRVVRALERCRATGRTLTEMAAEFARQPPPFAGWETRLSRLERPRAELAARIAARTTAMLENGLVDEVRGLLERGLKQNPSAAGAIGYRETIALLEGRLAERDLEPAIVRNTLALVKKQATWFRTQLPPHRVLAADTVNTDNPDGLFG